MSIEAAFLEDVIANPDDDGPRLVYADWLEDHGQAERAEFIRVQIALARMDPAAPGREALLVRERELLSVHAIAWAEPLRGLVSEWRFERGFIEHVQMEQPVNQDGLERLPDLFRLAPVRALALAGYCAQTVPALLANEPVLTRLRYLDLFYLDGISREGFHQLLRSSSLSGLETLLIDNPDADNFPCAALEAIAQSPALTGLREIGLDIGKNTGDRLSSVIQAIADSASLRLRKLYLGNARLDLQSARAVVRSASLRGLRVLSLGWCEITPTAQAELFAASSFPELTLLELPQTEVDRRYTFFQRPGLTVQFETEHHIFPILPCFRWPST